MKQSTASEKSAGWAGTQPQDLCQLIGDHMLEAVRHTADVFGVSRDLPLSYVERENVDNKLVDNLTRDKHVIIYGGSKQGKTCLRKHCLNDSDYVLVQCQNTWDIAKLSEAILKATGCEVEISHSKTIDGKTKIQVKASGGFSLLGLGKTNVEGSAGQDSGEAETRSYEPLQLDSSDPNDLVRALKGIRFNKLIVLEDFHYLPQETQEHFAFVLKTIHELSAITFIIVAVWREENRLIVYNGDLAGRVISVDADAWSPDELRKVIVAGEQLLNIGFGDQFKSILIEQSLGSVYIVQDCCYRACKQYNINETRSKYFKVPDDIDARDIIKKVIDDQGARYNAFIVNFSGGFQDTNLEMFKWILYPIITSGVTELEDGLSYKQIRTSIQSRHPQGLALNPGNLTQALTSIPALQSKKNIKPFILDYDRNNLRLSVVDKGFLFGWPSKIETSSFQYLSSQVSESRPKNLA
jgi:hypothetical protein